MGRPWKTKGMAKLLPTKAPWFGPFVPIFHDTGCWWGGDYGPFPRPHLTPHPYEPPGPKYIPPKDGEPVVPQDQPPQPAVPQDQPPQPAVPQDQPGPGVSVAPGPTGSTQPNPNARFVRVVNPQFWGMKDVDSDGYPWKEPSLHVSNYPTPGTFFAANNDRGAFVLADFKDLVRACLASALYMAGADPRHATSLGSMGKQLRRDLADLIQTSQFNDELYGTADVSKVGHESYFGPHGRGVNWDWAHADNLGRMHQRQAPVRTTRLDGARVPEWTQANARPLVWLPALDLDALRSTRPVVRSLQWNDGVSTSEPPATARQLGVEGRIALPGGAGHAQQQVGPRTWSHRTSRQVWGR